MSDFRRLSVIAASMADIDLGGVPDWDRRLTSSCDHCRFAYKRTECCQFDRQLRDQVNCAFDQIVIDDRKRRGVYAVMDAAVRPRYWRRAP